MKNQILATSFILSICCNSSIFAADNDVTTWGPWVGGGIQGNQPAVFNTPPKAHKRISRINNQDGNSRRVGSTGVQRQQPPSPPASTPATKPVPAKKMVGYAAFSATSQKKLKPFPPSTGNVDNQGTYDIEYDAGKNTLTGTAKIKQGLPGTTTLTITSTPAKGGTESNGAFFGGFQRLTGTQVTSYDAKERDAFLSVKTGDIYKQGRAHAFYAGNPASAAEIKALPIKPGGGGDLIGAYRGSSANYDQNVSMNINFTQGIWNGTWTTKQAATALTPPSFDASGKLVGANFTSDTVTNPAIPPKFKNTNTVTGGSVAGSLVGEGLRAIGSSSVTATDGAVKNTFTDVFNAEIPHIKLP